MKRVTLLSLIAVGAALTAYCVEPTDGINIDVKGLDVKDSLATYKSISHRELIIDSRVETIHGKLYYHAQRVQKAEGERGLVRALLDQCGIAITPVGAQRASVTYNDQWRIKPAAGAGK
jgi:hypothetical protein